MKYRTLGRTSLKVSEIGLGCEGLMKMSEEETKTFLDHAHKNGINTIDLYSPNPNLRINVGKAIKETRHEWILEAHLSCVWRNGQYLRTRKLEDVKEGFEDLLEKLQTDYIDIGMIHYVDEMKDFKRIFEGEVIEYVKELKAQGKIKHIGLGTHNPIVGIEAVKTSLVDVILFSINPCYDMVPPSEDVDDLWKDETYENPLQNIDPVRQEFYDICFKENVALTVMKAYGGSDLLDAKMSPFGVALTPVQCIHYCLQRPAVQSVMIGAHSIKEIDEAVAYETATEKEKDYAPILSNMPKHSFIGNCVYCGHCAPCPKGIDVANVNKFLDLCLAQNEVPETVREHYKSLEHHASECIQCGSCVRNCPFQVDIILKMRKAVEIFGY